MNCTLIFKISACKLHFPIARFTESSTILTVYFLERNIKLYMNQALFFLICMSLPFTELSTVLLILNCFLVVVSLITLSPPG